MLKIQELMHQGWSYERLYNEHGVIAKPYNGKISFAYDVLTAKDEDSVARQCRGLILEEGTWKLLAYPFDRFFNHGQGAAADIDMSTAAFEEKLDGTLIIAYYHKGAWHCATRQMCEAHGNINGVGTFRELVDRAALVLGARNFNILMTFFQAKPSCTYMFELVSPFNKIVCDYDKIELVLLGARDLETLQEFQPSFPMRKPQVWRLKSIDDMLEVCRDWSPLKYEGVILKDKNFNRIKIKTPQYLAMHHASESLGASWRAIATCVLSGCADDMLPQVTPTIKARLMTMQEEVARLITTIEHDYASIKHIVDMKLFAQEALKKLWSTPLFMLRRGKTTSIADYIRTANVDTVIDRLKANGWEGMEV